MLVVEIVDQDEIEIGARGHLATTELAEGQQRRLLSGDPAVGLCEEMFDLAMQRADNHVGEQRKRLPRLLRRNRARKNAHTDQEHVLLPEQPEPVEHVLIRYRLIE